MLQVDRHRRRHVAERARREPLPVLGRDVAVHERRAGSGSGPTPGTPHTCAQAPSSRLRSRLAKRHLRVGVRLHEDHVAHERRHGEVPLTLARSASRCHRCRCSPTSGRRRCAVPFGPCGTGCLARYVVRLVAGIRELVSEHPRPRGSMYDGGRFLGIGPLEGRRTRAGRSRGSPPSARYAQSIVAHRPSIPLAWNGKEAVPTSRRPRPVRSGS